MPNQDIMGVRVLQTGGAPALLALLASAALFGPGMARAAQAPICVEGPAVVLDLPWGSGGWMAGRRDADESAPEGPMSFAVSPAGELFLLDQVNGRVLCFYPDGSPAAALPLPAETFEDMAVTADGTLVLVDRLVRSSVLVMRRDGVALGEYPVTGEGIPEGGGITATFAAADGVWLEYAHERIVRVLDAALKPCARAALPGRMTAWGGTTLIGAALRKPGGAAIRLIDAATGSVAQDKVVAFDREIARVIWVGSDLGGRIYGMFHLMELGPGPVRDIVSEEDAVIVLSGGLVTLAELRSPYTIREWEQLREFEVTPEGSIYQMGFDDDGVRIMRWRVR